MVRSFQAIRRQCNVGGSPAERSDAGIVHLAPGAA